MSCVILEISWISFILVLYLRRFLFATCIVLIVFIQWWKFIRDASIWVLAWSLMARDDSIVFILYLTINSLLWLLIERLSLRTKNISIILIKLLMRFYINLHYATTVLTIYIFLFNLIVFLCLLSILSKERTFFTFSIWRRFHIERDRLRLLSLIPLFLTFLSSQTFRWRCKS
jgi:hypothetical protein